MFFSKYGPIWGWATWRRAWEQYDADLKSWPQMRERRWLASAYESRKEQRVRSKLGERMYTNQVDTWDFQWGFIKNYQSGLSIVPTTNLVVNLGFGADATHTKFKNKRAPAAFGELQFPLRHPQFILPHRAHDALYRKQFVLKLVDGFLKRTAKRFVSLFA